VGKTLLGEKPHTPKLSNILFRKKEDYSILVEQDFIGV